MMNETKKGFIQLHLSVMLAGFTGLFGRLVTLNEVDIVWYRMLFTSLILLVFTGAKYPNSLSYIIRPTVRAPELLQGKVLLLRAGSFL